MSPAAEPFQVLPQKEWGQLKKGLHEQVNNTANLLVNRLGINRAGRDMVKKGVAAGSNFIACVILLNKELKKSNPKSRKEWTTEEFKIAHESLDTILNNLTKTWKGILRD